MRAAVLAEQDRSPSADRPEMAVVAERRAAQEDERLRNFLRPVSGAAGEHENLSFSADTDADRAALGNGYRRYDDTAGRSRRLGPRA